MNVSSKIYILWVMAIFLYGCDSPFKHQDFTNSDPYKTGNEFKVDSKQCMAEKNKHSNKIQGREFGFEGEHTGYLGCMKLKGWSKN